MALTKIDDRGLKTPIDLLDGEKIQLGTGNDLQLWHTGSDSIIKDNGTGSLKILSDSFAIQNVAGTQNGFIYTQGGSVALYNNNNLKFETTSNGVQVSSGATDAHLTIRGGATDGRATLTFISDDAAANSDTWRLHNDANNDFYLQNYSAGSWGTNLKTLGGGAVELYHNGLKKFQTDSGGVVIQSSEGGEAWIQYNADEADDHNDIWRGGASTNGDWFLQNYAGSAWETNIKALGNGAVELYHDNNKVAETIVDGLRITAASNDAELQIRSRNQDGATLIRFIADDGDDNNDYWRIRADGGGNALGIQNFADGAWESNVVCRESGGTELYYDNSKKFETFSGGCKITGDLHLPTDGEYLWLGASDDLKIGHDGSNSFIQNTTGNLIIEDNSGQIFLQSTVVSIESEDGETQATFTADGAVALYYNNGKRFETTSSGVSVPSGYYLDVPHDSGRIRLGAGNDLQLYHETGDSFIVNSGGYLMVNCTSGDTIIRSNNSVLLQPASGENGIKVLDNAAVELFHDSTRKFATASHGCIIYGHPQPDADDDHDVGSASKRWDNIHATNGTIQTSDANEKNTIVNTDLGLSFINKLTPKSYKFNGKTRTHYGLIAQDVETVLSDISKPTSGFAGYIKSDISEKQDGSAYRHGLRYNEFIAPLIKAIQELSAEVETLKTKI